MLWVCGNISGESDDVAYYMIKHKQLDKFLFLVVSKHSHNFEFRHWKVVTWVMYILSRGLKCAVIGDKIDFDAFNKFAFLKFT